MGIAARLRAILGSRTASAHLSASTALQKTDAEQITQSHQEAIEHLKTALNQEVQDLERRLRDESGDVHRLVSERKNLARQLGLAEKLTEIYEEICFYPAWSKRDDFSQRRLCEVDEPTESVEGTIKTLSFRLGGDAYEFRYEDDGGSVVFDDYIHHTTLTLRGQSGELISVKLSVDHDRYGSTRRPFDIEAFVPGTWMAQFLDCFERLQSNRVKREITNRFDATKAQELKRRFGLEPDEQ